MADAQKLTPPEDIAISENPWISGTRAVAYYGPIVAKGFISYRKRSHHLSRGLLEFEPKVRKMASALGANAIVGFELHLDPFAFRKGKSGVRWHVIGTAARLERMF